MTYEMESPQRVLAALSDPTRQQIVAQLRGGARSVGEIAGPLPVSRPAVSQHLKVLSDCGLLHVSRRGTRRIYAIAPQAVAGLRTYLDRLWDDALTAYAAEATRQARQMAQTGSKEGDPHDPTG